MNKITRTASLWGSACVALSALSAMAPQPAQAVETNCLIRDPSTMVKAGSTYWIYGTANGVYQFSSTDRLNWTYRGSVFANRPGWVAGNTGNTDGAAWAPDVHYFNGKWYLYYSYSSFGTNNSGIGVATNTNNLDPGSWVDQGMVIGSRNTNYNAIDPCIFQDAGGTPWMVFGSYFSGIKLVKINPANGMRADSNMYTLAQHPQSSSNSVEASAIYYHNGFYYLFVNWDSCCAGNTSGYNIRVGRATSVTGPYLDKDGANLQNGGGSMFLCSVENKNNGQRFDDEVGPGHVGILSDTDGDWLSCHYEWARDRSGATTVNLLKLSWDADGWPRVPNYNSGTGALPGLTYTLTNQASGLNLDDPNGTNVHGTIVRQWTPNTAPAQQWTLTDKGGGFYVVTNVAANLSLDDTGWSTTPGALMELWDTWGGPPEQWKIDPMGEGYYRLVNQNSNQCLDDPGGSTTNGQQIGQWTPNKLAPQNWLFTLQPDVNGIVTGGTYKLTNVAANLCMDLPGGSKTEGQQIGLWTDNNNEAQHWKIEGNGDGTYRITSQISAYCLDDPNGSTANNTIVQQWTSNPSNAQKWTFQRQADGTYKITNVAAGKCLDDPNFSTTPGTGLQLYQDDGATAQRWRLDRVN